MRDQDINIRRARKITNEITRLSLELERILQLNTDEEEEVQIPNSAQGRREVSPPPRRPRDDLQAGDRVEISNRYTGLFGATRGSRGRVIAVYGEYIDLRLESNGKGITRKKKNVFRIPE